MIKLITILLIFSSVIGWAQNASHDTTYRVEITTSLYPVVSFFNKERVNGNTNMASVGYGISIRAMWHPARRLALGIMSGYNFLARDEIPGANDASAQLVSVPIQAVMTMKFQNLELGAGIGPYMMWSTIKLGNQVDRTRFELGITFIGSYYIPLNSNLYMGPELKICYMNFRGILSFMPSVNFHFIPLSY